MVVLPATLQRYAGGDMRPKVQVLMLAVGFILLICVRESCRAGAGAHFARNAGDCDTACPGGISHRRAAAALDGKPGAGAYRQLRRGWVGVGDSARDARWFLLTKMIPVGVLRGRAGAGFALLSSVVTSCVWRTSCMQTRRWICGVRWCCRLLVARVACVRC